MGILFYTSTVPVAQTVGEVHSFLARRGVTRISTLYNDRGEATGLGFEMVTDYGPRSFEMPVRIDGVEAALVRDDTIPKKHRNREQAARTAWRIALGLLEAQAALVDADLATIDELMLPFMVDASGQTAYQALRSQALRELGG